MSGKKNLRGIPESEPIDFRNWRARKGRRQERWLRSKGFEPKNMAPHELRQALSEAPRGIRS